MITETTTAAILNRLEALAAADGALPYDRTTARLAILEIEALKALLADRETSRALPEQAVYDLSGYGAASNFTKEDDNGNGS